MVETASDGLQHLKVKVGINAPVNLLEKLSKATLFLKDEKYSEMFGCRWMAGQTKGKCKASIGKKELFDWHRSEIDYNTKEVRTPALWIASKNFQSDDTMQLEGYRQLE